MTETEPITIRPATADDAPAVRDLRLEALRLHPVAFSADYETDAARSLDEWRERVQRNDGERAMLFLAWAGSELIGMCGIARDRSAKTHHSATIWGVYVRPAFRGRGIARELIDRCVTWARTVGLAKVRLAVATTNVAATRCYLRCGFRVYGVEPLVIAYDGHIYDELLMAKILDPSPLQP